MREALKQAKLAKSINEVPIGAVIIKNSKIIGSGYNQNISSHSVSAHAEIVAINEAGSFLKNYRLVDCDMYVTVEPCHMCAKAIIDARIKNLYFATNHKLKDCVPLSIHHSNRLVPDTLHSATFLLF